MRRAWELHLSSQELHRVFLYCSRAEFRAGLPPPCWPRCSRSTQLVTMPLQTMLAEGIDQGLFPRKPLALLMFGARSAFWGAIQLVWSGYLGDLDKSDHLEELTRFVLAGLVYQDRPLTAARHPVCAVGLAGRPMPACSARSERDRWSPYHPEVTTPKADMTQPTRTHRNTPSPHESQPPRTVGRAALRLRPRRRAAWWRQSHRVPAAAVPAAPAAAPRLELLPQDVAQSNCGEIRQSIVLTGTLQPLNRIEVKAPIPGQVVASMRARVNACARARCWPRWTPTDLQARLRERQGALDGGVWRSSNWRRRRGDNNAALLKQNFISQAAFDNARQRRPRRRGHREVAAGAARTGAQGARRRDRALADGRHRRRAHRPARPVGAGERDAADGAGPVATWSSRCWCRPARSRRCASARARPSASKASATRRFEGQVERISPSAAAGSRSIAVYLRMANPEQQLRGGMFAQGSIAHRRGATGGCCCRRPRCATAAGSSTVLRIDDGGWPNSRADWVRATPPAAASRSSPGLRRRRPRGAVRTPPT